jgi:hypothetical protein
LAGYYKGKSGHAGKGALDSPIINPSGFVKSERPFVNSISDVVFKTQH